MNTKTPPYGVFLVCILFNMWYNCFIQINFIFYEEIFFLFYFVLRIFLDASRFYWACARR